MQGWKKQTVSSLLYIYTCVCVYVCALKVRQSVPCLQLHRFSECVLSCAYLTGEEQFLDFTDIVLIKILYETKRLKLVF